jgi:hypothetical protein
MSMKPNKNGLGASIAFFSPLAPASDWAADWRSERRQRASGE